MIFIWPYSPCIADYKAAVSGNGDGDGDGWMAVVMVMDGGSGDSAKILRGGGILICLTPEI